MTPSEYKHAWYIANRERLLKRAKEYRSLNSEKIKAYHAAIPAEKLRGYRQTSQESRIRYMAAWRAVNAGHLRVYARQYTAKKREDVQWRLAGRIRKRILRAIESEAKTGSAVTDLGCSIEHLKLYLEQKFLPGMSWGNWGLLGWHIDHIVPLATFDLSDREQFLRACHYTNLQPLWAKDNLRKGANIV